jgi:hypothetical protein
MTDIAPGLQVPIPLFVIEHIQTRIREFEPPWRIEWNRKGVTEKAAQNSAVSHDNDPLTDMFFRDLVEIS